MICIPLLVEVDLEGDGVAHESVGEGFGWGRDGHGGVGLRWMEMAKVL